MVIAYRQLPNASAEHGRDDPAIRGALPWYLEVAENRRPAKFRIAATIGPDPREYVARLSLRGGQRISMIRGSLEIGYL